MCLCYFDQRYGMNGVKLLTAFFFCLKPLDGARGAASVVWTLLVLFLFNSEFQFLFAYKQGNSASIGYFPFNVL